MVLWPLMVRADLGVADAACFGARRLLQAKKMADSGAIFGELCGVGLGGRSML